MDLIVDLRRKPMMDRVSNCTGGDRDQPTLVRGRDEEWWPGFAMLLV